MAKGSRFEVFRNKWFSLFYVAAIFSKIGSHVYRLAIPWIVMETTGSVGMMSLMFAVEFSPYILISPFIGVFIDRWDRKKIMLYTDFFRAVLVALIPLFAAIGFVNLWVIFVFSFLLSTLGSVNSIVSDFGLVPKLVPSKQLATANSVYMSITNLSDLVGPVIAGACIGFFGARSSLYFDAVTYLFTFLVILFLPISFQAQQVDTSSKLTVGGVVKQVGGGLAFIFKSPLLRSLILVGCTTNLGVAAVYTVMTYHLGDELHLSSVTVGTINSISGLTALLGSYLAPLLLKRLPLGRAYVLGSIGTALGTVVLAAFSDWRFAIIGYLATYSTQQILNIYTFTIRQKVIPFEMMGRINSSYRMLLMFTFPFSSALLGWLANTYGARAAFICSAVCMLIATVLTMVTVIASYQEERKMPASTTTA